jgi:hypothetical protein
VHAETLTGLRISVKVKTEVYHSNAIRIINTTGPQAGLSPISCDSALSFALKADINSGTEIGGRSVDNKSLIGYNK